MSFTLIRNNFIIFLFSISIFFSHVVIYNFQIRFLYLFSIIFLIIDLYNNNKQINKNFILSLSVILIIITLHSYYNLSVYETLNYSQISNVLIKSIFIYLTIILIFYYNNLILENIKYLVNIFYSFFFLYLLYIFFINDNFFNFNLINCSNIFRFDKFLFKELSHFHILSVPVILFSIVNLKETLSKKLNLFFAVLLFLFSIFNFSLTFFVGILCGTIITLITCKNLSKFVLITLLFINLLNIGIFFSQDNQCIGQKVPTNIINKNELDHIDNKRPVLSPKQKLFDTGILNDNEVQSNYSYKVYKNSLLVSIESLKNKFFGYGFDNYNLAFNNYKPKNYDEEKKISPYRSLNQFDASNNLSKLISEFGVFFLIISLIIIFKCRSTNLDDKQKSLIYTLLFMQIFIRGTGIFNNGFIIISVILLFSLFFKKKTI